LAQDGTELLKYVWLKNNMIKHLICGAWDVLFMNYFFISKKNRMLKMISFKNRDIYFKGLHASLFLPQKMQMHLMKNKPIY
jgi:hypothetical protein